MTEIVTPNSSASRVVLAVAGLFGAMLAGALILWAYYGTAVFTEMIIAGLNACF
ncbi:MAG TPA: hypothetical protein VGA77_03615 [Propylenella sp.]